MLPLCMLVEKSHFIFKKITKHALTLFLIIQHYVQSGLEACSGED